MSNDLDRIAWDWGVRCFGIGHMSDLPLRALRMVEEAVETGQSLGLSRALLHLLVEEVYKRSRGETAQEIGGTVLTTRMLCWSIGSDPEELYLREIRRCLGKTPQEFAARNQYKIDVGLTAAPPTGNSDGSLGTGCLATVWHPGSARYYEAVILSTKTKADMEDEEAAG